MKRAAIVLALVGLGAFGLLLKAPPVMATGGGNPGFPGSVNTTGPAISGVLIVDLHMDTAGVCPGDTSATPVTVTSVTCVTGNPDPFTGVDRVTPGPKAKYGAIRLKKGSLNAGAIFRLPKFFAVNTGCNASLDPNVQASVTHRFGVSGVTAPFHGLRAWILPSIVDQLLMDLGIPLTAGEPVITGFANPVCTSDDSENPPPLDITTGSPPNGGILSVDFTVNFVK